MYISVLMSMKSFSSVLVFVVLLMLLLDGDFLCGVIVLLLCVCCIGELLGWVM